jgi:hypothetical protein
VGGGVQVGAVNATCSTALAGTIRFNTSNNKLEYCNGSGWTSVDGTTASSGPLSSGWIASSFNYDAGGVTGFCTGNRYVKSYGQFGLAWIGIILCNAQGTQFSIFASNSQSGTYYPLGDSSGSGEDHCQVVGFPDNCTAHNTCTFGCQTSTQGFRRAQYGETFQFGVMNPGNYYFGRFYSFGTQVP